MGVAVAAVAGKVLEDGANAHRPHLLYRGGHILRRGGGVLAQGTVIDEVGAVGGYVRHRSEVYVDAVGEETLIDSPCVLPNGLQAPLGIHRLGRFPLGGKEVGVPGGPGHSAALLVHADKQGDLRCRLIGGDGVRKGLLCEPLPGAVLKIPAEEEVAPQVVLTDLLRLAYVGAADKKHLPHLFRQGHVPQKAVDGLLTGIRLRFCRGGVLRGCIGAAAVFQLVVLHSAVSGAAGVVRGAAVGGVAAAA